MIDLLPPSVLLRNVTQNDLPTIFEQMAYPESSAMAAVPSRDKDAFDVHWARIMADENIILRTIEVEGQAAGHLVSFLLEQDDRSIIGWERNIGARASRPKPWKSFWIS